ncbi:flavoprotein [Streptomyces sp. NPDC056500]|uniref:flavoprotein n=1 Tax=Streptomyces sp. NPDC056500 TaxID=3345840 RepID=UPI0036A3A2E7
MTDRTPGPFLYIVVCAAQVASQIDELIAAAQERRWRVGVVVTPQALGFVDRAAIEARTGLPIRSAWRRPDEPRPLPPPDAVVVAPATFNTINKWAAGISDTLALGILCESVGSAVPIAVLPCLSAAQATHPAYAQSLERLRSMGVLIDDAAPGGAGGGSFGWSRALDLLEQPSSGRPPTEAARAVKAPRDRG